jgi:hypothetical protein
MLLLFGRNTYRHQFRLHTHTFHQYIFSYSTELHYHCSGGYWIRSFVPKVDCTAPWGAVELPRGALEVGPSERVVRLFTIDQARA